MMPFLAVAFGVWLTHYLSLRAYRLGHTTTSARRH